jgi:hypothetical protein
LSEAAADAVDATRRFAGFALARAGFAAARLAALRDPAFARAGFFALLVFDRFTVFAFLAFIAGCLHVRIGITHDHNVRSS